MIFFEADLSDHHGMLHVRYDYTIQYTINIIYHVIDYHGNSSHATLFAFVFYKRAFQKATNKNS